MILGRSLAYAIFAVLCMAGLRYYFKVHQEHQRVDDMIQAKIAGGLTIPLDCPPFGKLPVHFDSENSSAELDEETVPQIVKGWSSLWPHVYEALSAKANDYGVQDEFKKSKELTVVLPATPLDSKPDWSIDDGNFTAEMAGDRVKSTSAY